jgi:hypothetical protein
MWYHKRMPTHAASTHAPCFVAIQQYPESVWQGVGYKGAVAQDRARYYWRHREQTQSGLYAPQGQLRKSQGWRYYTYA